MRFAFISLLCITLLFSSTSVFAIIAASKSEVDDETPFSYVEGTGRGPTKWGHVSRQWKLCSTGKLQSPINLVDQRVKVFPKLGELNRNYKNAPAVLINSGHDISVKWEGDAGGITINGSYYKLLQCHWHIPAEHTFNGTRYNMELHIVHVNSQGNLAVIGILYKYGHPDTFLAKVENHVKTVGHKGMKLGMLNPWEIKFGSRKYYRYIGSLTVPPCTQGVIWSIVKKVRTVSRGQLQALQEAVHDGFEANARPIQRLDGRPIFLYEPPNQGS